MRSRSDGPRSRTGSDRAMVGLARLLVGVFFRSVEVDGVEHLPGAGATVLVANHQNGLVDGIVLMAALPRYPRFLGKATLWRILPLRPLLALAGVIPIHRVHETGDVPAAAQREAGNAAAFASSRRLLGEGVMVAIFPEGISHDEPTVQSLRTGAARIALDAGPGTVLAPAGLVYGDKSRFRSRALVRLGPVRPVDGYPDDREGVRALTADLAADLRAVAPDFTDWEAAGRWSSLAEVVAPDSLGRRDQIARRLAMLAEDPVAAAELAGAERDLTDLRSRLALLGVGLDDLADPGRLGTPGLVARSAAVVALAAPATAAGLLTHIVPYTLVRIVARRPANVGMRATVKVAGCLGLFPLTYAALGIVAGRRRGWATGLAVAVATPLCGWVTVLAGERLEDIGGLARAREGVRRDRAGVAALRARRVDLAERLSALLGAAPAQR